MTPPPADLVRRIIQRFSEACENEGLTPQDDAVFHIALTILATTIALHSNNPAIDDHLGAVGLFREPGL